MSQQPVRIVITVDGGIVQAVTTLGVPVEVCIIDFDTDGSDPDDTQTAPDGGQAFISIQQAEQADEDLIAWHDRNWEPLRWVAVECGAK